MNDNILEKYGIPEEEMVIFSDIRKLLANGSVVGLPIMPFAVTIQFKSKEDKELFGFACATIKNNIEKLQQEKDNADTKSEQ